jgi:hypothetical protein
LVGAKIKPVAPSRAATPVIPALGRLRLVDREFEASLGDTARLVSNNKNQK